VVERCSVLDLNEHKSSPAWPSTPARQLYDPAVLLKLLDVMLVTNYHLLQSSGGDNQVNNQLS
jgi:hypothetical protein